MLMALKFEEVTFNLTFIWKVSTLKLFLTPQTKCKLKNGRRPGEYINLKPGTDGQPDLRSLLSVSGTEWR